MKEKPVRRVVVVVVVVLLLLVVSVDLELAAWVLEVAHSCRCPSAFRLV